MWRIKINYRRFLGRLSTDFMTLLITQIHFETNLFLSTKVIREREKRGLISYLSAWGNDRRHCLRVLPSRKNEIYLCKMATKLGMYSATHDHESITVPVGRDRKIQTALRTNQIAGFVTVPTEEKKRVFILTIKYFILGHYFLMNCWWNILSSLSYIITILDRRPKNEDPNFFARIRHGQLKNQAKAFLSANRCENNGDLRFVEKTPWIYKTKTLTKTLC